jgi:hypothetical protein
MSGVRIKNPGGAFNSPSRSPRSKFALRGGGGYISNAQFVSIRTFTNMTTHQCHACLKKTTEDVDDAAKLSAGLVLVEFLGIIGNQLEGMSTYHVMV